MDSSTLSENDPAIPTLGNAIEDLERRSLAELQGDLAKLIYLASTRDYNTGRYHHEGLVFRFNEELASAALESVHRKVFERIAVLPLEALVRELEALIRSGETEASDVLQSWKKLRAYLVLIPKDCDPVMGEFFFSNIRIAVSILERRLSEKVALDSPSASQLL